MRFLIDQNRSPKLAELLRVAGHDAVHTLDMQLQHAEDDELLAIAAEQGRVVVSGDTDFGALMALTRSRSPSVILFRTRTVPTAVEQSEMILRYLNDVVEDLAHGAVIVISDDRIRVRRLPLLHDE